MTRPNVDILIVTALTEEQQVVNAVMRSEARFLGEHGFTPNRVQLYEYDAGQGNRYLCASGCAHTMGAVRMGAYLTSLLQSDIAPVSAVLVGIAATLKSDELQLGDVPIADEIYSADNIKVESGMLRFRASGYQVDYKMRHAAGEIRADGVEHNLWRTHCRRLVEPTVEALNEDGLRRPNISLPAEIPEPRMMLEVGIGGPFLISDKDFGEALRKGSTAVGQVHSKSFWAEMESHGFMEAAHTHGVPAIVMKGISDAGDAEKAALEKETGGFFRAYSCSNSLVALLHILRKRPRAPIAESDRIGNVLARESVGSKSAGAVSLETRVPRAALENDIEHTKIGRMPAGSSSRPQVVAFPAPTESDTGSQQSTGVLGRPFSDKRRLGGPETKETSDALEILRELSRSSTLVVVHYSCESFSKDSYSAPRVTSIALCHVQTGQTQSFAPHLLAEIQGINLSVDLSRYEEFERRALESFYRHITHEYPDCLILHWHMRSSQFGFPALEHRLKVLGGEVPRVENSRLFDLPELLVSAYGSWFAKNPQMQDIFELNQLSMVDFMPGNLEPLAFAKGEFSALHRSTLRKVRNLGIILKLAASRELKVRRREADLAVKSQLGPSAALAKPSWKVLIACIVGLVVVGFLGHRSWSRGRLSSTQNRSANPSDSWPADASRLSADSGSVSVIDAGSTLAGVRETDHVDFVGIGRDAAVVSESDSGPRRTGVASRRVQGHATGAELLRDLRDGSVWTVTREQADLIAEARSSDYRQCLHWAYEVHLATRPENRGRTRVLVGGAQLSLEEAIGRYQTAYRVVERDSTSIAALSARMDALISDASSELGRVALRATRHAVRNQIVRPVEYREAQFNECDAAYRR